MIDSEEARLRLKAACTALGEVLEFFPKADQTTTNRFLCEVQAIESETNRKAGDFEEMQEKFSKIVRALKVTAASDGQMVLNIARWEEYENLLDRHLCFLKVEEGD